MKSLTEIQTAMLDTISFLRRILTVSKESSDARETPSNTTLFTYHQQQQQQHQQQH